MLSGHYGSTFIVRVTGGATLANNCLAKLTEKEY